MMNNSIGLKNFRKFADFPESDLGDITILVGSNNSGKSTLVKALLLCIDNLKLMTMDDVFSNQDNYFEFDTPKFRFDANDFHDVKVKTFDRAIHNKFLEEYDEELGKTVSRLPATITFKFKSMNFSFEIEVTGERRQYRPTGDVISISITDYNEGTRFYTHYINRTMSYEVLNNVELEQVALLDKLYEEYNKITADIEKANAEGRLETISDAIKQRDKIISQVNSLFDREGDDKEFSWSEVMKMFDRLQTSKRPVKVAYEMPLDYLNNKEPVVLNIISTFINFATAKLTNDQDESIDNKNKRVELKEQYRQAIALDIDSIRKTKERLEIFLNSIRAEYISVHAAHQNTIYNVNDRNDYLAQTIHEFCRERIQPGEDEYEFIRTWMKRFGIGSDFSIKAIEAEVYLLFIKDDEYAGLQHLADKGMGAIQIMVLLLKLATIMHRDQTRTSSLIIIEEPEQNLHPKYQSILADLFEDAANNHSCNFVIETHSEYLVRKTQVLVAESKYKDEQDLWVNNPFKVYYLPEDGSERFEMKYKTSGRFANKFHTGFFDTASELAFDLF